MISNFKKNCMGTAEFDGLFLTQRKPQRFLCYPLHSSDRTGLVCIQSDKRIGYVNLTTGTVCLSPSRAGGSYQPHLALATPQGTLPAEELFMLKAQIFATAHGDAGRSINRVIGTDNAGAMEVFA